MNKQTLMLPLSLLVASLAVVGCHRNSDSMTAGKSNDTVVAQAEERAKDMQADASKTMSDAKDSAREAAQDLKDATKNAADAAGNKVNDAVITTTVNAELAKDKTLSALKINVDTDSGRVALRGTAPSEAARERATQLAMNVKGVVNVDNQLTIEAAKM